MSFCFTAKKYFLTYAQCAASKDDLLAFLRTRGGIDRYVIGQEQHEDGNPHLHCVVVFTRPLRSRVTTFLDLPYNDGIYHPHVQSLKTNLDVTRTRTYTKKDGDFIESDNWDDLSTASKRCWSDVLEAQNRDDFFAIAREVSPRDFVLQHDRLISYANRIWPIVKALYCTPPGTTFGVPAAVQDWATHYVRLF